MSDNTEERTLVDDILDAVKRGVSENEIRKWADHYLNIAWSADDGFFSHDSVKEAAEELGFSPHTNDYQDLGQRCLREISYRLSGVYHD